MKAIDTSTVTPDQINMCDRCVDESTMTPFYMVKSESDPTQEYKVSAIQKNGRYYYTCTCPAGLKGFTSCKDGCCKHVRWSVAAAKEYRKLIAAEAEAAAKRDVEQRVRQMLYQELGIQYTNVDTATLKRMVRREQERKEREQRRARKAVN